VAEQGPTNRLGRQRPEACRGHHRRECAEYWHRRLRTNCHEERPQAVQHPNFPTYSVWL